MELPEEVLKILKPEPYPKPTQIGISGGKAQYLCFCF